MHRQLNLHPDSRCTAVSSVEVEAVRSRPGSLLLTFVLTGRVAELRVPPMTAPARTDKLWTRTCFEAFIRAPPSTAYYEFNFAPSRRWAAYRFTGYRCGMVDADGIDEPRLDVRSDASIVKLQAALALDALPDLPANADWRLGLSAVIEDQEGGLSHWALAHPPGAPDFHHSVCFAGELGPA